MNCDSRMRLLIVAARYLPHRGGLETVVREVSREMRLAGHVVAIVTNRYPRRLPRHEEIDGIPVTRLQFLYPRLKYLAAGRIDLWLAGWVYAPLTAFQLLAAVVRFRPSVVNLHYLGEPGLFVWLLHHLLPFRLVVSLHGGDVDGEPYESGFKRWLFRAVLRRAVRVTACSRALLDQAATLAPEIASKAQVLHNGVDTALFANARPFVHSRPYLLAVGQLERHKGFDVLLSAFAQARHAFPDIDLLIAGAGRERVALQAQIQDEGLSGRAQLLGSLDREAIASLMRGCLMFVIPSRREPFGIVAVEAMASGRPIIATHVGGMLEALEGANAIWVQPGDVESLKAALLSWVDDTWHSQSHVAGNQSQVARFDWSAVTARYINLFSSAL